MILRKIATHIRQQDWFTVVVELLVVVVGLLLAFQVDRWREFRADRELEATYIQRLVQDLDEDIPALEYAIRLQTTRLDFVNLLIRVANDPLVANEHPVVFMSAVTQSAYTYTPSLTAHTFDDLRSTGNMNLLLDPPVKSSLYDCYGFDNHSINSDHCKLCRSFAISNCRPVCSCWSSQASYKTSGCLSGRTISTMPVQLPIILMPFKLPPHDFARAPSLSTGCHNCVDYSWNKLALTSAGSGTRKLREKLSLTT